MCTDLRLDDLDEEQNVVDCLGEQGHLTALLQKGLFRRLQPLQQLAPKQSQLPGMKKNTLKSN